MIDASGANIFRRFSWAIIIASETLAVAQLWDFDFASSSNLESAEYGSLPEWTVGKETNAAAWIILFLFVILFVNCLPVIWYGRLEYIFGCLKMIFIVGLILFNVVIHAMRRGHHDRYFWTYDEPYSFTSKNITIKGNQHDGDSIVNGSTGIFLAMWTAMTTTVFSMIGLEAVSITAGENRDLQTNVSSETIKIATRKISLRIVLLYTLGVFTVGLNVPYTDGNLRDLAINDIRSGQNSAFILSAVLNDVHGWPNFFNGFFIFSATSAGINSLYISSRILHALAACQDAWPANWFFENFRKRLQRTMWGIPYPAICASWFFGFLAFLGTKPYPSLVQHPH